MPGFMENQTIFKSANNWHFINGARDRSKDLKVNEYYAWVVNSSDVISRSLALINVNRKSLDGGGAVFAMTYTPKSRRSACQQDSLRASLQLKPG